MGRLPIAAAGESLTYTVGKMFGVTNLYCRLTATIPVLGALTIEFAGGWKGNKVAEAEVLSGVPQSNVYALEQLALNEVGT